MIHTSEFLKMVIDSISEHILVIDAQGVIQFTNKPWTASDHGKACLMKDDWCGINYLSICEQAGKMGDEFGKKASAGIRDVLKGSNAFYFEYPCPSQDQQRWFMMTARHFDYDRSKYLIISHIDITERKRAEEYALNLSQMDGLTGLFNRRHFDSFLSREWKQCARLGLPITLAMIDVDHFKLLNDTYGHLYGDDCLIELARIIKKYAKRPSDLCARYGGEEIAMIFGNAAIPDLLPLLSDLSDEIRALNMENRKSPVLPKVTVSIGVATTYPRPGSKEEVLLERADRMLYEAKKKGRNRIEYHEAM